MLTHCGNAPRPLKKFQLQCINIFEPPLRIGIMIKENVDNYGQPLKSLRMAFSIIRAYGGHYL